MEEYVQRQDKAIASLLAPHRGSNTRASLDTNQSHSTADDAEQTAIVVLPLSTDLFYVYGQILEDCARRSTGRPLFDLLEVFKKWLRVYAKEVLMSQMRRTRSQPRRSTDVRHEIRDACLVVNTAGYCQTTVEELEKNVHQRIHGEFKERISLQEECDLFISVAHAAIETLLRELESVCEPALMSRKRTTTHELVTRPRPYIDDLVHALESTTEAIIPLIESKIYQRYFIDKASSRVITRLTNALDDQRSRLLKENRARQLLVDLPVLRACLLKLPGKALLTPGYTRRVTESTEQLEAQLKVIFMPQDPAKRPKRVQTSFHTESDMDPSTTGTLAPTAPNSSRVAWPGIGGAGIVLCASFVAATMMCAIVTVIRCSKSSEKQDEKG